MLPDLQWCQFDAIYHEYGALVLLYKSVRVARRAFVQLQQSAIAEKSLLVLVLPHIQVKKTFYLSFLTGPRPVLCVFRRPMAHV